VGAGVTTGASVGAVVGTPVGTTVAVGASVGDVATGAPQALSSSPTSISVARNLKR
jgi:hypothetical protein